MKLHNFILGAACMLLANKNHAQEQSPNVSIHFEFDKSDINAGDMASLKNFKATHPGIESVVIDGYADPRGTDEYNYALSQRRCNAVKKALGYDENKTEVVLRITAHGEIGLLFQTNPENRVAIVAVNQKKQIVQEKVPQQEPVVVTEPVKEEVYVAPEVKEVAVVETKPVAEKKPTKPKEFGSDESGLLKQLRDAQPGESVVLSEIRFEKASHVLLKSSRPSLNAMLEVLKALPTLEMEIQGHMCCDDALTMDGFDIDTKEFKLSYNRAETVYEYMVNNGIDASRLSFKGFGTRRRLVNPENTDDDRGKNRRVEFLVVKK